MDTTKTTRITKNSVRCKKCNTVIESKHRNDLVFCPCGNIGVDGGRDYIRRLGDVLGDNYEELSTSEET